MVIAENISFMVTEEFTVEFVTAPFNLIVRRLIMKSAKTILLSAARQYRHNSGGNGFVKGYDVDETEKIVSGLLEQLKRVIPQPKDSADFCTCSNGATVAHLEDTHCIKCKKVIDQSY